MTGTRPPGSRYHLEIQRPPGKSTRRADASLCCRSQLTSEPDSALALAGKLFLLARLPPTPQLRALSASCRALCGIAERAEDGLILLWKCSCLRMPTASPGKGFVRRLPEDCGAWRTARSRAQPRDCEPARHLSLCPPSPPHPRPPAALTSTSCSVKATLQKEKCCQGWRHHGALQAKNALGLLPGVPATTRSGDPSAPHLESGSCAVEKEGSPIPRGHSALGPPLSCSPWSDTGACWSYLCKPSLSSTETSLGKLSSSSSGVSASAGRQ